MRNKPYIKWEGVGRNPVADEWVDFLSIRKPFRQRGVWRVFAGLNYFDRKPVSTKPAPFGTWNWLGRKQEITGLLWRRKRWNVNSRWDRLSK